MDRQPVSEPGHLKTDRQTVEQMDKGMDKQRDRQTETQTDQSKEGKLNIKYLTGTGFLACCSVLATEAKNEVVETLVEILVAAAVGAGVAAVADLLLLVTDFPLAAAGLTAA